MLLQNPWDGFKNIFIKPDGERGKGNGRRGGRHIYVPGANKGEAREKEKSSVENKRKCSQRYKACQIGCKQ